MWEWVSVFAVCIVSAARRIECVNVWIFSKTVLLAASPRWFLHVTIYHIFIMSFRLFRCCCIFPLLRQPISIHFECRMLLSHAQHSEKRNSVNEKRRRWMRWVKLCGYSVLRALLFVSEIAQVNRKPGVNENGMLGQMRQNFPCRKTPNGV